jgi:hypothetical protein
MPDAVGRAGRVFSIGPPATDFDMLGGKQEVQGDPSDDGKDRARAGAQA